jgi:DHA1 family multidrug resistance protein-like MFS transporter
VSEASNADAVRGSGASSAEAHESREWVGLTALFMLASFVEIVLFSNLSAFTPVYLQHLGFDEASNKFWTGVLASIGMLLGFWLVPMWGVLADRYGRKPLIVRSFAVEVVACVLMAVAPNIWIFTLGRMLTGLALGNTGLMYASVSSHAPRKRIGLAIALISGSGPLGAVVGALFGGYIVEAFGVVALWWFNAFTIGAVVLILVFFYHDHFERKPTPPIFQMLGNSLRAVAHTPIVVKYFIFSFLATSAFFFTSPFLSTRLIEIAPGPEIAATIGTVFGIAGIATFIATPLWGTVADRVGHERLLPVVTFLTGLAYIPLYFASSVATFTVGYFALSSFSPAINGLTFATIGLNTPIERRNAVMSMLYMPLNAAIVVAPTVSSLATTEIRQVFVYSALLSFAALAFLWVTRGIQGQREAMHGV